MFLEIANSSVNSADYTVALIAVGGTVLGATIASLSAAVMASRSARNQMAALDKQLEHASLQANRDERRRIYANYNECMGRFHELIYSVNEFVLGVLKEKDPDGTVLGGNFLDSSVGFLSDLEREQVEKFNSQSRELLDEWWAIIRTLDLTAGLRVKLLASEIFEMDGWRSDQAWRGGLDAPGEEPYMDKPMNSGMLMKEMRRDLGLVDTFPLEY